MESAYSEEYFKDFLKQVGLFSEQRWKNLQDEGWANMTRYARAWDPSGLGRWPSPTEFRKVVVKIEGFDWHELPPNTPDRVILEPPWQVYKKTMFEALAFKRKLRAEAQKRPQDTDSEPERTPEAGNPWPKKVKI